MSKDRSQIRRREAFLARVFGIIFLALLLVVGLSYRRLEGRAPRVVFDRDFETLGRTSPLELTVEDPSTGLKEVRILLTQGESEVILVEDSFDGPGVLRLWGSGEEKSRSYDIGGLIAEKYKVQEGPAMLSVDVSDYSLRHFLAGNRTEVNTDFQFDIYPPRLEALAGLHYINQGGSDSVLYRVSEDATASGVQVGPHFFPGFPVDPSDPELHFSLFAFAYNLPADTPITIVARDGANNEARAGFGYSVKPRAFRSRDIVLGDSFLQKVVPEIVSRTPGVEDQGDLIDTYVEINSNLRRQNHEAVTELSAGSEGPFLWEGAFLQLSNSQVESFFADRRTYMYQGKRVDQQDHVGFDLSVVQRYPIEAANSGKVILAEYFGIYGNTVLVDHGSGLVSLYAHMSSIEVERGQTVSKKGILGRSGATGLAGGDHLHFGLFLHGVPVNPIEWWDPKWVQEHVLDRMTPPSTES